MSRILSTTMLLFFFLGQINLSWAKHYCGDKLVGSEISIAPEKSDCCGDESENPMNCCEDQLTTVDADDHFSKSEIKAWVSPEFVLAYTLNLYKSLSPKIDLIAFNRYQENLPVPDFLILHQRFLI